MPTVKQDAMGTVHRIGLPPVVGRSPKVMILGTIPSVLSDRKQQYYGNPQNQFWKIVHRVFGSEPSAIYEERLAFLKERRIALWDVLHECDIEQSKDHSIINPVANDIETFLRSNQDITHVFLNGKKAFELFERLTLAKMPSEFSAPVIAALPSTSTANPVKFLKKVDEWKVILMALGS